ncbi:hypothetical protein [Aphanizomenon flos-aquae]|uniref:hypothetical protein n=1 Tax=Aphanizomenon flos-aquae TaxID=1176 RepID=UPI000907C6E5|nr:hypothetical protein [Aphanizomenon flos-aquae]
MKRVWAILRFFTQFGFIVFTLCAACYVESPCHRIEWQFKVTQGCQHHSLSLLSECPNCGARFKVPALWVDGWCHRCFLPFGEMIEHQKRI